VRRGTLDSPPATRRLAREGREASSGGSVVDRDKGDWRTEEALIEPISNDDAIVAEIRRLVAGRRTPLLVAVDGRSGAGKSTLAARLAARVGGAVVEGDDFYAGGTDAEWAQRSAEAKVDACIDWRRLKAEALEPLLAGRTAIWHPFNFASGVGLAAHTVSRAPAAVIILDGVYSARPELQDLVGLAVLVDLSEDRVRRQRLEAREGKTFMDAWHALWDQAEDYYFSRVRPPTSFDLVVTAD
jgi:uridine kinase